MTTRITIKNENQGAPYADWDIEVFESDGIGCAILKPGESKEFTLWHDGRRLSIREMKK